MASTVSRAPEAAVSAAQPGMSASSVLHDTLASPRAWRRSCHTVCIRAVVSTPIATSTTPGLFDLRDFPLPDVQIGEVAAGLRQLRRIREIRLLVVWGVQGPAWLTQQRVRTHRARAVVLGQQAVDIHPTPADRQRTADQRHLECIRRSPRHHRDAGDACRGARRIEIGGLGADAPLDYRDQFIPVGVEQ